MTLDLFASFTLVNLTKPRIRSSARKGRLAEALIGIRDRAQKQTSSSIHDWEEAEELDFFIFIR